MEPAALPVAWHESRQHHLSFVCVGGQIHGASCVRVRLLEVSGLKAMRGAQFFHMGEQYGRDMEDLGSLNQQSMHRILIRCSGLARDSDACKGGAVHSSATSSAAVSMP